MSSYNPRYDVAIGGTVTSTPSWSNLDNNEYPI